MSPKWSYSESANTVLWCEVVPNRVVRYFVQHDFTGREKPRVEISGINLFHILHYRHCAVGLVTSTQHRALLFPPHPFFLFLVISDWIECSALPVHTLTLLNMICILISQTKPQLMRRTDTDGGGFEGSRGLESRHGGFAPCTVSPRYYPDQELFVSVTGGKSQKLMMKLLKESRCTGESLHTSPPPTMTHEYSPWEWSA